VSLATRLALEFLILTASRTTEVLEAHWNEINLDKKLWVIPADRMKASRDHEVPLTERMIGILQAAADLKLDNGLFFPSSLNGKAMSNNTLRLALQKRLVVDATVHGMRSAFKEWAAETTTYPNEVSEMALAHTIGSKVEAAYRRGNLLTKRRQMMTDWDAFLTGKDHKVIQLHETGDAR
jgi:integrase